MSSLPTRHEDAFLAEVLVNKDKENIFLFVEDEKLKLMYELIIKRLFDKELVIGNIFSMKKKGNVLNKFEEWKDIEEETSDKAVFIVDKDFDHLIGEGVPNHPNLIELEYYTIENYLISKPGALLLMKHKDHDYDLSKLDERLNWEKWEEFIFEKFERLFLSYGMAFKYDLGPNCSISPHKYLAPKDFVVEEGNIEEYISTTSSLYEEKYNKEAEEELNNIKSSFIYDDKVNYHQLISGKYLLEALIKYVDSLTSYSVTDKNLIKTTLLNEYPLDNLLFLKDRINVILNR